MAFGPAVVREVHEKLEISRSQRLELLPRAVGVVVADAEVAVAAWLLLAGARGLAASGG
jgi:hypothetical protein